MPNAEIVIDGRGFPGWKSVRVSSSLEQVADSFDLSFTDRFQRKPYPIDEGDACQIRLAGRLALTGFVDAVDFGYSASSHDFTCRGRSAAADAVDASAIWRSGHWSNATIGRIAADLLEPFGLKFRTENLDTLATRPMDRHGIELGESVAECLGRFARKIGAYITSEPDGTIVIGRAGSNVVPTGVLSGKAGNVLTASRSSDLSQRFSHYTARGQRAGSSTVFGDAARGQAGTAADPRVTRYRPLLFSVDGHADGERLERAAEWRRNTAAGRSLRVSYTVKGWTVGEGPAEQLWRPGQIVRVEDPLLRLTAIDLLLVSTTMTLDVSGGSRTALELAPPESLQGTEPPKEPSVRDGVMSW